MLWVALWTVLLLGSAAFFVIVGRDVWRKGRALSADVAEASARLEAVVGPLQEAADDLEELREELAVFADPAELRRARKQAARRRGRVSSVGRQRSAPGASQRSGAISQNPARPSR